MRMKMLKASWLARPTVLVAEELIGKVLVRKLPTGFQPRLRPRGAFAPEGGSFQARGSKPEASPAGTWRYRITEVEAYCGVKDLACHAARGCTPRTEVMFGPAGHIYVYLIYGMYYCLNLVTAGEGEAEAVLVRSVEPLFVTSRNPVGPGRLCRELNIDHQLNQHKLGRVSGLWLEDDGYKIKSGELGQSARRGIEYAKDYASKPWRFYLKSSLFVS